MAERKIFKPECRTGIVAARPASGANARYNLFPIQQGGIMTISMYAATIPVFRQLLGSLDEMLTKAEAYAAAKKIDPSVLLQARLFPDMLPFTKQIQIATDFAKGAPARL